MSAADVAAATGLSGARLRHHQRRKRDLLALVVRHLPRGSRMLDVGCASGDIAVELGRMGYRVHGIDFEPQRLERARQLAARYGLDLVFTQSSFDDLAPGDPFDGILLGEVLEHFSDPAAMLRKVGQLLKPGGRVILTTPNMPSLQNRLKFGLLGRFPDNNREHRYYFDDRRLREVVNQTPFQMVCFETRYTNLQTRFGWLTVLENVCLGWFWRLFRRSGDTIFTVLAKRES